MTGLDDTDLEILRLLAEDARRPYSEIADRVGLAPPTVSERIDRLQESGVLGGFTVEVDRSLLDDGMLLLVEVDCVLGRTDRVRQAITDRLDAEHVLTTADGRVLVTVRVDGIDDPLNGVVDPDDLRDWSVTPLTATDRQSGLEPTGFALTCAECGNTVTSEGEQARLNGERYHFCCPSCRSNFEERYERLQADRS